MSIAELPPPDVLTTRAEAPRIAPPRRYAITYEQAAYVALLVVSLITHLWALDNRALHHDETLHAAYSYTLLRGQGFIHDPLLHGPFLYFWGAFVYFLFGDTNYTARLGAALFGSVLTVVPYLLRHELGRGAALLTSIFMLFSPVFLYVGRFDRHDIYAVTFELLTFISLVRYAGTRDARWLFVGAAALGLMFSTMETFFLFVAIFLPVVLGAFFGRVWRWGAAVVILLALVVATFVFVLPGQPERPFPRSDTVNRVNGAYVCPSRAVPFPPANPMLVERPGPIFGLPPLATADNSYALCVRHQPDNDFGVYLIKLGQFFGHPAILAAVAITLATLAAMYVKIWRRRDAEGLTPWERARASGDGVLEAFASLRYAGRGLIALGIFFGIYALFFSAFFTNPVGAISGTTGSLLYWMAQHEVERGGQPRHFYLVLLTVYEPLVLLWSITGLAMVGRMLARRRGRGAPAAEAGEADEADGEEEQAGSSRARPQGAPPIDWGLALPALLAYWSVATFFLYSWAGEKMPWLTIHVALPLTLLAGWALARTLGWWRGSLAPRADLEPAARWQAAGSNGHAYLAAPAAQPTVQPLALYLGIFAAILGLCYLLLTFSIRTGGPQLALVPWVPLIGLTLIALLTLGTGVLLGPRWAIGALAIAATLAGLLYGARSAYQLNFRWGDVPREMLIYTQTSPDVARVIDRLEKASIRRGGGLDMLIWYDNETVWDWYMRRFTRAVEQPAGVIPAPPDDLMAMLILSENLNDLNRQNMEGFRVQRYPLRWWFPEDQVYRLPDEWMTRPVTESSPLLMRMLRTPFDGRTAAQFWDYMLFRNLHAPLGSTDFVLAVRPLVALDIGLGTGEER